MMRYDEISFTSPLQPQPLHHFRFHQPSAMDGDTDPLDCALPDASGVQQHQHAKRRKTIAMARVGLRSIRKRDRERKEQHESQNQQEEGDEARTGLDVSSLANSDRERKSFFVWAEVVYCKESPLAANSPSSKSLSSIVHEPDHPDRIEPERPH